MSNVRLLNVTRHRREYRADIYVYGVKVGHVEREQSGKGGGMGAGDYRAVVEGVTVGLGRTLADIRFDLAEWVEEERALEDDAVWLRLRRDHDREVIEDVVWQALEAGATPDEVRKALNSDRVREGVEAAIEDYEHRSRRSHDH
jgi:hypothetical protein